MNLNDPDNLYFSDPFNILSPQSCYIDFPSWPNPNRVKPNNPWIPAVPFTPPPRDSEKYHDFQEIFKKLRNEPEYFTKTKDSLKFRLEVVGYGKEHISAEIKGVKANILLVSGKRGPNSFSEQYEIPSPEKLDLSKIVVRAEHGLLEITFSTKEDISIKVL